MKLDFLMRFEGGMPKGTSQEKGERILYRFNGSRRVPYIQHYRDPKVEITRQIFIAKSKPHKPKKPFEKSVRLTVILYFDVKEKRLWGNYKPTRPDCDNYVKEIKDVLTVCHFWNDDNQVADLRVKKYYSEKAAIYIRIEDLKDGEDTEM